MTTYTTSALAAELLADRAEANLKAATRTLRKFLRDDMGDGKAVVGKGGRYALELTKPQLRAMAKRFAAWEIAQEEAAQARREALAAKRIENDAINAAEAKDTHPADGIISEDDDAPLEGPTDEEIAAMLADED